MKDEIAALHANATWSLVSFDPSMNIVGDRWVYKIKCRADGPLTGTRLTWFCEGSPNNKV
jgi:hypothetical protein